MGRPLFDGFLSTGEEPVGERGLEWQGDFVTWDALLARGRERALGVQARRGYVVDPTAGHEGLVSFFAVAVVPDTLLLWARASPDLGPLRQIAPGLYEMESTFCDALDRPLWGILTSGSTGVPKVPVGYADTLELVALHYDAAVFQPTFARAREVETLATCLPLQFSAAFFMTVLPAIFLRRNLLVFAPHDWRPLCARARREHVICQSVPVVTVAGSLSAPDEVDMSRVAILLGAGYVTHQRIRTIRDRFRDVVLANIYGTAETGAISLDRAPGHSSHVGRAIPGKPVWVQNADDRGIGVVTTTGPDCRSFYWTPGRTLEHVGPIVSSTDYGHFDGAGHLCLDGRLDAGEKLHGVTVYPRIVERHILQLDGVVDVRVHVTSSHAGREELAATVVGSVDPDHLREYCGALPEGQRPTRIECISERDASAAYTAHGKLRQA